MEKIKLLLYCTRQMPRLVFTDGKWWLDNSKENTYWKKGQIAPIGYNGKIVAECDFEVEEINRLYLDKNHIYLEFARGKDYHTKTMENEELLKKSCLTPKEIDNYLLGENGYAIHIKNLNIFDKPKELNLVRYKSHSIKQAPQNMMKVYDYSGEYYILISIRPEWLCKILNGEKTIEVRKKVLKEMI